MARTPLTSGTATPGGLLIDWENAVADGNSFPSGWRVLVLIRNSSAGDITATIDRPGLVDGEALADRTIVVAAGTIMALGVLDPVIYGQADGTVHIDWSTHVNVQLILVQL